MGLNEYKRITDTTSTCGNCASRGICPILRTANETIEAVGGELRTKDRRALRYVYDKNLSADSNKFPACQHREYIGRILDDPNLK